LPAAAEDAPEWVLKGPGVFQDGSLYAVGIAQGKKPRSILIRAADNRARANLAAGIKSTVQVMTEDFERSTISTDEMVTRVLVYDGTVEVTDLKGTPASMTVLNPGEKMMVVVGEGFGKRDRFTFDDSLEDWNGWEHGKPPSTKDE
jgi:ferric-dicitrate binding protein FerR (iron transport regulator)